MWPGRHVVVRLARRAVVGVHHTIRHPAAPTAAPAPAALRRASTAAAPLPPSVTAATERVGRLAGTLSSGADVEDLVITYAGANPAIASGAVRPLAVVKVGGEVITKDLDNLIASLRFMTEFGLQPVVVHGGGPQLNDELAKSGVQPEYIGGHRVTSPAVMTVAQRVFEAANGQLSSALTKAGLPAGQLLGGIFKAEVADAKLGLVGEIGSVVAGPVNDMLAAGRIPVLTSLGLSSTGQTLNINADVAARELAIALKPLKVVFISAGGGWKEDGRVVDEVNMAADYDRLVNRDYTGRQGTLLKLKEMKAIVDHLPPSSSVTIASAAALANQLLPHRGPGTQIRRGVGIHHFHTLGSVDCTRLASLFRSVGDADTAAWLATPAAADTVARVITTEDYSAAAVVVAPTTSSTPMLKAMAVTAVGYTEGSESALWRELRGAFPALQWLATGSPPLAAAVEEVRKGGVAAIPATFPPLSARRSSVHAQGAVATREGAAAVAGPSHMWWGMAPTTLPTLATVSSTKPVATPSPGSGAGARSVRVGLLGARGYVGRELVRLLNVHPHMQVVCASSRAMLGKDVVEGLGLDANLGGVAPGLTFGSLDPEALAAGKAPEVDVWVLALPNGMCAPHATAIMQGTASSAKAPLLIDLSADMRFDKTGEWVYGLPERRGAREKLRTARKISNPGCYATGAQAALMPLVAGAGGGGLEWDAAVPPHVFGVSGYSGAGTTPSDKNDPTRLRDNLLAYSLVNHIHEREVGHHCGLPIAFMPHVASWFQGIHLTVTGVVKGTGPVDVGTIAAQYRQYYSGEPLMRVAGDGVMPDVARHGTGQHGVTVGGWTWDPKARRLALVSVIDNLLKGAATQAVQNMNLACGLGEYEGIPVG